MKFRTFAGVALTMFAVPAAHALAADPPKPVVTKVFAVGDILGATKGDAGDSSKRLMKTVTQMVRPHSWDGGGGAGKIEFFDIGGSVVVTNSEDVLGEVADLIETFRRVGDLDKLKPALVRASDAQPQIVTAPFAPCALPLPAPVCCAESWAPPSALDHMRKLAAAHAATGARASYVVKFRNVAAADAATAIQKHLGAKCDNCAVVVDAKTNALVASGEPEQVRRVLDLAHALDVPPLSQIVISAMVVNVSRDFVATAGLSTEKGELAWSLSARETQMLAGLIRLEKVNGKLEMLARQSAATQPGRGAIFNVGQNLLLASGIETKVEGTTTIAVEKPVSHFVGVNCTVTPVSPTRDGSVSLSIESEHSKMAEGLGVEIGGTKFPGFTNMSVKATANLKKGESCVVMTHNDKDTVTLVVLTPSVVVPELPACPGWFTK